MDHSIEPMHHMQQRKRMYLHHEPFPHPNKWKRFMDKAIYVIGILGPIMTIPQVWDIWVMKNAAGVSVISWASYTVFAFFWLAYGILHKEKPIIVSYTIWIFLNTFITLGAIIYG